MTPLIFLTPLVFRGPDQFGPSRVREAVRVFQRTPLGKRARWRRLWRQQIQDWLIAARLNVRLLV